MLRRIAVSILSTAFFFSVLSPLPPAAAETSETDTFTSDLTLEEGTYEDGQVLVTIATPKDTPLTEEGEVSFDSSLTVENAWDFGDAAVLANTEAQQEFMEDKTLYVVKVSSDSQSTEELISELDNQAYVVSVEPDYYQKKMSVSNDTFSDYQWYLGDSDTFSTSTSEGIRYSDFTQSSSSDSPVVAVVDTGIDYTHPDLAEHMWKNTYSTLSGTYGYDFGDGDSDPMDNDEDGHGTHCAGVIGAVNNNNTGITGVANDVRLMALKVFDKNGSCTTSSVTGAFNYIYQAQQLGVNITAVNCSWGGGSSTSSMSTLIEKIGGNGALFIFASGNDGTNHDTSITKECPYDLNSSYVVTVGASTPEDTKADYSDYGAYTVDLFAPGEQILSTVNNDTFFPSIYTEEQKNELTSYFTDFSDGNSLICTAADIGKNNFSFVHYNDNSHSSADYFNKESGSQCISISATGRSSRAAIYLDVTSLDLDTSSAYYVACDIGLASNGTISWEHGNYRRSTSSNSFVVFNDRTYLLVVALEGDLRSISSLYIDNVGISKGDPDTSDFGKYNIYDGTSMAAPSVSAAVALLASSYPSDSAIQRRERLMTCVRSASGISAYCKTKGILDLSKIPSATCSTTTSSKTTADSKTSSTSTSASSSKKVKVKKVKLNKKTATLRYKKKLKLKATVTPSNATNKKVKWYVSNKKYASVTQTGVVKAKKKGIGHTVKVYAKAKDGSNKKAYCKVKIKKAIS